MSKTLRVLGIGTMLSLACLCGAVCLAALVVPAGNVALSAGLVLVSGWATKMCVEAVVALAD